MAGSGWSYAFRSAGWMLLVVATLGFAHPWRQAALERYKIGNSYFGDLRGEFKGSGWGLFKASLLVWLVAVALFGLPLAYFVAQLVVLGLKTPNDPMPLAIYVTDHRALLIAATLSPVAILVAWPIYQAIEWRWWLNGIRFGRISFTSGFPMSKILVLYLKYLGWMVPFAVIAVGLATAIFRASGPIGPGNFPGIGVIVSTVLLYLATLLILGAIFRYFFQFRLWSAVVQTLVVNNLDAAASVTARGEAANALGEGLADGLDVAGF